MDVREKLVELLQDENNPVWRWFPNNMAMMQLADYLISNGVTVQEWVSVKDRLPEPKENAICFNRHGDMMIGTYTEWGWMFPCYVEKPTHWIPLPEQPKGE